MVDVFSNWENHNCETFSIIPGQNMVETGRNQPRRCENSMESLPPSTWIQTLVLPIPTIRGRLGSSSRLGSKPGRPGRDRTGR